MIIHNLPMTSGNLLEMQKLSCKVLQGRCVDCMRIDTANALAARNCGHSRSKLIRSHKPHHGLTIFIMVYGKCNIKVMIYARNPRLIRIAITLPVMQVASRPLSIDSIQICTMSFLRSGANAVKTPIMMAAVPGFEKLTRT